MAQSPPGLRRMPPPPPRWSFRPSLRPPPPYSRDKTSSQPHGRIVAGVLIGIVASLLVSIIVCSLCRGHRNSRARAARARSPRPERSAGTVASTVRVDQRQLRQACAASGTAGGLPAFTYSRSVKQNVTGGAEETATCSVCLAALRLGETVRLLPACLHLYHAECIDPWLYAHSTCPICRSDTDPAAGVGRPPPV